MKLKGVFSKRATPQSQPIPGTKQVPNSAGGYAFPVDDWVRLDRFLVLGAEGGSYYASEQKLSRENAEAVVRCIQADGARLVARIVEISRAGRAPKNSPAIFALALAASLGDEPARAAALAAMPAVCRTGTHLYEFCEYAHGLRGWGRGLRRTVAAWYQEREPRDLAYQLVKYQQRNGWSHRDLLRLTHPKAEGVRNDLLYWAVKGWPGVGEEPHPDEVLRFIWAFERAKRATSPDEVAGLVREYRLPREAVPTPSLTSQEVWAALLDDMPMTAMIRSLATMSRVGLLVPGSEAEARVIRELGDAERLRRARVHPIALLSALKVYEQGHGERSKATWTPCPKVVDALDGAFYAAFRAVEPTGKRYLLALDVSGSMTTGVIAGVPGLTPRVASAAMALVTRATEANCEVVGFYTGTGSWMSQHQRKGAWGGFGAGLGPLSISPRQRLDDVLKTVNGLPFGGTDCALPMLWALDQRRAFDAFVIYTDSETWANPQLHPVQALREYRQRLGIPAKLVTVGMVSNGFSIADPDDAGMMDVVGFDAAAPQVIGDFVKS